MRNILKHINTAAFLLMLLGVVMAAFYGYAYGAWACGIGLALLLISVVWKAFHWQQYAAENRRNIVIMLLTIVMLLAMMIFRQ